MSNFWNKLIVFYLNNVKETYKYFYNWGYLDKQYLFYIQPHSFALNFLLQNRNLTAKLAHLIHQHNKPIYSDQISKGSVDKIDDCIWIDPSLIDQLVVFDKSEGLKNISEFCKKSRFLQCCDFTNSYKFIQILQHFLDIAALSNQCNFGESLLFWKSSTCQTVFTNQVKRLKRLHNQFNQ